MLRVAGFLLLMIAWQWYSRFFASPMFPGLDKVFVALVKLVTTGEIFKHMKESYLIVGMGFLIASMFGFVFGTLLTASSKLRQVFMPLVDSIRPVAALTIFPLLILLLGLGRESKIVIILWTAWPAVLLNTMQGIYQVPQSVREAAQLDGASRFRVYWHVAIPLASPTILTGLRIGLSGGWISLVAAEMLGSNLGLGYSVLSFSQTFRFPEMYAVIVIIALSGLVMNQLLVILQGWVEAFVVAKIKVAGSPYRLMMQKLKEGDTDVRQHRMSKDRLLKTTREIRMTRAFVGLLVVVLIFLLVSCGAAAPTPVPTDAEAVAVELPVVRYIQFKIFDPVYFGIEKGFFNDHGIEVVLAGDTIAGPNAIQAVSGGSAEAGLSSVPAIINANAAGLPIQGVVDVQTTLEGQPLQKWFVLKDSDIQTINEVEGRTYGINITRSSFHYTSLLAFDTWGVDESKVEFKLLSFPDQITALINGDIDVAGLIPPYHGFLLNQYGDQVRELWNDYELYGERHVSLIFVNRIWARENPVEAQAFVAGIVDAINWSKEHPAEAKDIIEKYTGVPAEAIMTDYQYTPNGEVHLQDVQAWLDYLIERGDVTVDWLQVGEIATNEYVEAATQ